MNTKQRTLAYNQAFLISDEELSQVAGGSNTGTTHFTTKESVDRYGNWDVGADLQWD